MSATERPSLLNDMEALSLELKRTKPVAMTLVALESYARSVDMPETDVERHAEAIREMDPSNLKRLRKALHAAAELCEILDLASADTEATEMVRANREDVSVVPTIHGVEAEGQPISIVDDQQAEAGVSTVASVIKPEADASQENRTSDLSENGKRWVLRLIPEYDFEGMTAIKVANDLYSRAGSPQTRTFGGKKIDPKLRIRRRLRGMNNIEIAEAEGGTPTAVSSWFSNAIDSKIKFRTVDSAFGAAGESEVAEVAEPETNGLPEAEPPQPVVSQTEREQSALEPSTTSSATVRPQTPITETDHDVIDVAQFATYWAKEMKLSSEDAELLVEILDPGYSFDLSGSHRDRLHHFRQFMQKRLPKLEDSDLDLSGNEIARLSRLLGRVEEKGEYSFTARPQSAREVSMADGYVVSQYRDELLNGLEKIYNYMQAEAIEDAPNVVSQFKEALSHAGFADDQIVGLEATIGLRDAEGIDPAVINDALHALQVLIVEKSSNFDPEDDKDVQASLRMISNTAMGRKTVNDVYHRLHGKDNSVTRQSVIEMLESGIIKLAM